MLRHLFYAHYPAWLAAIKLRDAKWLEAQMTEKWWRCYFHGALGNVKKDNRQTSGNVTLLGGALVPEKFLTTLRKGPNTALKLHWKRMNGSPSTTASPRIRLQRTNKGVKWMALTAAQRRSGSGTDSQRRRTPLQVSCVSLKRMTHAFYCRVRKESLQYCRLDFLTGKRQLPCKRTSGMCQ